MKIENTYDYLKYRAIVLSNKRSELSQQYNNNKMNISEIRKKIDEIKSVVDEGFEMFSPKAAEEKSFNKQEVKELQMRLLLIIDDNKELNNKITMIEDELKIIHKLLDNKTKYDIVDNNLKSKLKFLADIAELDARRVKIELDNLIKENSDD